MFLGQKRLHFFAQRVAFFAQHDSPVERNHRHAVHFALTHFQCHVISSSSESGSGGNHFRSPKSYHFLTQGL
jgi:hypothetical protein